MPLTRKLPTLIIAGLFFANVLIAGLAGYNLWQSYQQHLLRGQTLTETLTHAISNSLRVRIDKIDMVLKQVAYDIEHHLPAKPHNQAAIEAMLKRNEAWLPIVRTLRITDEHGIARFGEGVQENPNISFGDRDYFPVLRERNNEELWITPPIQGRIYKGWLVGFVRSYRHPDGRFAGIITASVPLEHFAELLSQFPVNADDTVVLRHQNLGLIARYPAKQDSPTGAVGNTQMPADLREHILSGVPQGSFISNTTSDGIKRLITYQDLPNAPMVVSVGLSAETFLHDWY